VSACLRGFSPGACRWGKVTSIRKNQKSSAYFPSVWHPQRCALIPETYLSFFYSTPDLHFRQVMEISSVVRQLSPNDGVALYELVAACPPLDLNSRYAYLLLCRHHAKTCVIAECDGVVAGAITAYVLPAQPDTLFVWRVAVAPRMRGKNIGTRMLQHLLQHCIETLQLRWMETSISPSNHGFCPTCFVRRCTP
jgi:diaminobutyrate acetyltransferase